MTIDKYFKDYLDKYKIMKRALKDYVDAKMDFYTITGINYDEKVKGQSVPLGLDSLIANIETLEEQYIAAKEECNIERQKCLKDISKLNNDLYEILIEYIYLDREKNNKKLLMLLNKYNNIEISYSHLRNSKSQAIKEFKNIISTK